MCSSKKMVALWNNRFVKQSSDLKTSSIPLQCHWEPNCQRRSSLSLVDVLLIIMTLSKWKHFPRNWPFGRGIHRSPMNSPHKGQWREAFFFFHLRTNKRWSIQSLGWWVETRSCPLWRYCNDTVRSPCAFAPIFIVGSHSQCCCQSI